jgi:hypothetical protein
MLLLLPTDQMWLAPGSTANMRCQWSWSDQDFASPPFLGTLNDGTVTYGFPLGLSAVGGAEGQIEVRINTFIPFASVTNPFAVTAVTQNGSFALTVPATVVGAIQTTFTANLATDPNFGNLFNTAGSMRYTGIPGIAFRVTNNASNSQLLTGYAIRVSVANSATPVDTIQPRFSGISMPDEDLYCKTVDQYRVVSMSEWLEYDGSDLKNGGQCASLMYRGGQSAMENGLGSYTPVSEAPEAYAGKLKEGTYTIWAPNSDKDMLMRGLSPHDRWEFPYIVNAGIVAEPDQLNALRIRIAINYEFVSRYQAYDFVKPIPHPEWIAQAALVLRRYPCAMANGRHWDWIKSVTKDLFKFGHDAYKWGEENKEWLIPAASAVGALLL